MEMVDTGPAGAAVEVIVEMTNPTDRQLPVRVGSLSVRGADERGGLLGVGDEGTKLAVRPFVTIPPNAAARMSLPGLLLLHDKTEPYKKGDAVAVRGTLVYQPTGPVRGVLTDSGVPLPRVDFSGKAKLTARVEQED